MSKKKLKIILLAIAVILVLTNPSNDDFVHYIQGKYGIDISENTTGKNNFKGGRTFYIVFFSIYTVSAGKNGEIIKFQYFSILENFIPMSNKSFDGIPRSNRHTNF